MVRGVKDYEEIRRCPSDMLSVYEGPGSACRRRILRYQGRGVGSGVGWGGSSGLSWSSLLESTKLRLGSCGHRHQSYLGRSTWTSEERLGGWPGKTTRIPLVSHILCQPHVNLGRDIIRDELLQHLAPSNEVNEIQISWVIKVSRSFLLDFFLGLWTSISGSEPNLKVKKMNGSHMSSIYYSHDNHCVS